MTKEEAVAELDERGFAVLKEALTPDQANALRDCSVELAAEERAAGSEHIYHDGKSQRVWSLVNKGRIYEEMLQLPQVLELQRVPVLRVQLLELPRVPVLRVQLLELELYLL